jgi:hypothetical protein
MSSYYKPSRDQLALQERKSDRADIDKDQRIAALSRLGQAW